MSHNKLDLKTGVLCLENTPKIKYSCDFTEN